ncbi:MAG: GDSL-type esterase/lipase family protein [candidate division KSB1 bacterium]|nr:GDSL-type esterase/lipase family protein [candidate division KSB1 bacterium]MDZ7358153.1 GDSL-type esterase/lipase family protein [candidate division KSB1 bacterium]
MKKPYDFSTAVMVVMVSVILMATWQFGWGQTYKVMPLGDSITRGVVGSSTPGGYRDDLKQKLSDEYVNTDFVGSLSDGSFSDPQHEGHDGANVEYVNNNVVSWVTNASPNFVLLNIGTNDLGFTPVETIADKINSICDKIYSVNSGITIFLSSILPRGDNATRDSLASQVNKRIKRIVTQKLEAGYSIYYVGNNELFRANPNWATEYLFDGLHPNDTGYTLMAELFWSAIMNVIKNDGTLVIDNFNRSEIGIAWEYDPAFSLVTVAPGQRELENTSNDGGWNMMAIYKAVTNPGQVSIRWGQNADALGIENGGLALKLNKPSTTANGYLLRVEQDGTLDLWTIVNGAPSEDLHVEVPGKQPKAGQVFTVKLSSDAVAHHFHCYLDGNYIGTVSDYDKKRGNEAELYAGVMIRGSMNGVSLQNNVDNFNLVIVGDITPPAKIKNLAVSSTSGTSVTLTWTAPGDDSLSDRASFYDIRYSTSALTDANWNSAKKATNIDMPKAPGSTESFVVMGLESNKRYYFGIKTADEEYNWSLLSNVVDATTVGGAALQKSDDFSDPNTLNTLWSANPSYVIKNGELDNTSTVNNWGQLAVFKANVNPIEASITWSANATSEGIDKGALALMLDSDNYTTANGYMAWIRTQVGDNPVLYLFTHKAGTPETFLGTYTATGLKKPGPGDVFKVAVSSDASGHHFDYYVNEKFYGRINDPNKTYSNGTDYYMGIELHGNLENNVDKFVTVNTVGAPSEMKKVKPIDTPTGIVGKPLADSLIVRITDKSGNPISGVNVDFTVTQGGGKVDLQSTDNYVRLEAEKASVIQSPMEIGVDPGASNSQYVTPNGGVPLEGKIEHTFYVKEAGTYVIWCRIALQDNQRHSLFVQVDGKPTISATGDPPPPDGVWDYQEYEPGPWVWRVVTDRAKNGDIATFTLTKGNHKLTITQRSGTGTWIDKILLSNNYSYVPSGLEQVQQYITDSYGQARAQYTLGTVAGENRVEAIAPAYTLNGAPVVFVINGNADIPTSMVATTATNVNGVGGQKLAQPFEVALKDKYNNAAANYEITFTITEGDGFLTNGQTVHKVKSDANGKASTYLTLGTESATNKVVASFGTLPPITFTATATSGIAKTMQYHSGNSQSGKVGTTLLNPLKVKILDNAGNPVVNHNVKFQVTGGGGSLVPVGLNGEQLGESAGSVAAIEAAAGAPSLDVLTGSDGTAAVKLILGFIAGTNTVQATSSTGGAAMTPIDFNATAIPDMPDTLIQVSGNNQTGAAGMQLSNPFVVKVTDNYNNPIGDHEVKFSVTAGNGYLDGTTNRTVTKRTDPQGTAQVYLTLGQTAGVVNTVKVESYYGGQVLLNSGFETLGAGGADVFANWDEEISGTSSIKDETASVHGGSHACLLQKNDNDVRIRQTVKLYPGQEYTVSFWGKISGATNFGVAIKNQSTGHWWNGEKNQWETTAFSNKFALTADYKLYSLTFTTLNAGDEYRVIFETYAGQTAHSVRIDDVSLSLKATGTTAKALPGSPVNFNATAGVVTSLQSKTPINLNGSAGVPLDDTLAVYVKDNYGNPVGGYPVTFSSTSGDNPGTFNGHTFKEVVANTDSRGIAQAIFYPGNKPGVASIAKAIATGLTGSPITYTVQVAELTELKYVDGNNQTGTVGTALPKPLIVKVVDQRGKAIPYVDVTFKVVQGKGKVNSDSVVVVKTDTSTYQAQVIFTLGPTPGTNNHVVEASASYKGKALTGSPVRFTASATIGGANELVEVSGNYQRTVVGSPLENPLVVMVGDVYRNPISGHPVTFTVKSGGGFLDGDSTKKTVTKNTDKDGKAQVVLTVGRVSGQNNNTVEVVAYKPGTQTHLTNSPMTFYASGTHSAAHTLETVSGANQPRSPVRQALAQPFVVKVKDRNGNPVSDHPVQWEVVQGGGTFDGLTDSVKTVNTNANGLSQVYYYPGPVAGLQNVVRARSWNQVELNGSPRTFVVETKEGAVSAKNSVVSATSPVPADGETKSTITVILQDDWGNKISNKVVGFLSVTGSNNVQSGFFDPTDATGKALGYLASKKAEVKVVRIRDITDGINLEDTASVRFTPLAAHSIGYVSGTDQIANFGTAVKDPIKAVVLDVNGNPIQGHPVKFEVYEGGGYIWEHQQLKQPFIYTDQNGIAAANWVLGPSIEVNRAKAVAEGLAGSGNVRYIATGRSNTASALKKVSGDLQTGTAGLPLDKPLVVKVVDKNNDPIFDHPVKFNVEFGGGNFSGEPSLIVRSNPFGEAIAVFTLGKQAGSNVASASAPGLTGSPQGFTAQGVAGKAAKIVKWAGEGKTGPVGGRISGIQVKVTDIFDNAVAGYTVNFAINKGDATISGPSAIASGPDGIASLTINVGTTMGEIEIIAAAPGLIGDGLIIKVYAVAAAAVEMKEYAGNNQQGTIERELVYPLSVVVLDQYGNPAGGQNIPISFVMIEGNGVVLDRTVYSNENGVASARFQLGNMTGTSYKVWAINNGLKGSPIEFKATGVTNKFPLFDPIPTATIRENQNINFKVNATDGDNDAIRYGIRNLPQGAMFDSLGSRQFNWTPNYFQAGKHVIHFMAWDNKGGFDDEPVTIIVENVNRPPQITYYEPISINLVGHKNIGETFRFLVQVSDPDYDPISYSWYDNNVFVSAKSNYDFYVADNIVGSHQIKVVVSDGYDTVERSWALYVKTPVQLASFSGRVTDRHVVELEWETTVEVAHAGFNLLRKSASDRDYQQINLQLIKSDGTKKYRYVDRSIEVGETYSYKLEDVSISGEKTQHDPITVMVERPKSFKLAQNYPNPFNPTTMIEYQLPEQTHVTIVIYNMLGQEVRSLVDEIKPAGYHSVIWNGLDNSGGMVTSGVYYYRMTTPSFNEVKKMVLVR